MCDHNNECVRCGYCLTCSTHTEACPRDGGTTDDKPTGLTDEQIIHEAEQECDDTRDLVVHRPDPPKEQSVFIFTDIGMKHYTRRIEAIVRKDERERAAAIVRNKNACCGDHAADAILRGDE